MILTRKAGSREAAETPAAARRLPADAGDAQEGEDGDKRELVSATRVFRAGEEDGEGGGRRVLLGLVAVFLVIGAGGGAVIGGFIPGVSLGSILNLFSTAEAPQVVQQQNTGPVLEAVSGDDAALSLPRPLVDVQSEIVAFAGFSGGFDDSLNTPQSRRELAQQIAGFIGEAAVEEPIFNAADDDLQIIGLEIDGEAVVAEELIEAEQEIKTAAFSRDRKQGLDARTPSDRVLSQGLIRNNSVVEIIVAQASDSESESESESPAEATASGEEAETAAAESEPAEEIEVKPSLDGVDRKRMLNEAGRFYVGGAYAEAEAVYRNILSKNATNIDALRGLALVAVASGRYQLAVATYLKILEYYPNDPVAVADLTNLHGVSGKNFHAVESALKKVLGKHPKWDSRLHFALGNLYAGDERWTEAQKSYFNAYSGEQTNPDYAYNLAVVLDYLNKPRLAVTYYREALELSARAPSGFSAAQVRARIAGISQ